jgi:hypothetical protein
MTSQALRPLRDQILVSPWAEAALHRGHKAMLRQLVEDVDMFFPTGARFDWLYRRGACDGFYVRETGIECNSEARLVLLTTFWVDEANHCLLRAEVRRFVADHDAVPFEAGNTVAHYDIWCTRTEANPPWPDYGPESVEALHASLLATGFDHLVDEAWARAEQFTAAVVAELAP